MDQVSSTLQDDNFKFLTTTILPIFITLALSFLIGLEREEHADGVHFNFGGVRTYPIIGLCGYLMALLSGSSPILISTGALAVAGFLWISFQRKLQNSNVAGATSEISALFTYLIGALVFHGEYWQSTALTVAVLFLLQLKNFLERMAKKIPPAEVFTFTRFLLISAVILPIVPNHPYTAFEINPFHTWLIVVAISGISYAAYLLSQFLDNGNSLIASSIIGGFYSSTSTTVVLAKKSKDDQSNPLYPGALLIASGCMYLRLIALVAVFNIDLCLALWIPFAILALLAGGVGFAWVKFSKRPQTTPENTDLSSKNPLELKSALIFGFLFTFMSVLTAVAIKYIGSSAVFGLSFISGIADVDPFVMSLTQNAGKAVDISLAAKSIIIASASNDFAKGAYAAVLGRGSARKLGSVMLVALGLVSLLALLFI